MAPNIPRYIGHSRRTIGHNVATRTLGPRPWQRRGRVPNAPPKWCTQPRNDVGDALT